MLWSPVVVAKSVKKKTVTKVVVAKPVVKTAPDAKPVVAAKSTAPQPIVTKSVAIAAPVVVTPAKAPDAIKAPIIAEGKTIMNDTVTKVQETAQKFTADATARATEMFGDVSARAKTAMEKGSKGLEEMVEFSKGNLEAVVASGRVAAKGAQEIAKYSAEYGRKSIEDANATAKKFAAVKSPTEFFALQSEVAKTNLDAFVGEASKFAEGYMKLVGEIMQPMQNRYAVAVEKVKSATAA
jgi:phasin family protein